MVIKISENLEEFISKVFPNLETQLRIAQMHPDVIAFMRKICLLTLVFTLNFSVVFFFIFLKYNMLILMIPTVLVLFILTFMMGLHIPAINQKQVEQSIESDIFIPSRMLLTLMEAGNSLITALVGVSYTRAKSSKYFGKIGSEIFLGKNIEHAIDDAIKYTPSESFRRVLDPIKKSLKTGTNIHESLSNTLNELSKEKTIEIERYEKKLSPLSLFYMIFGTIIPAIGVVGLVVIISVLGLKVEFFPFLFLALMIILIVQLVFISVFRAIRPQVKL